MIKNYTDKKEVTISCILDIDSIPKAKANLLNILLIDSILEEKLKKSDQKFEKKPVNIAGITVWVCKYPVGVTPQIISLLLKNLKK